MAAVASRTQKGSVDMRRAADADVDGSQNTSIVTENEYVLTGGRKRGSKLHSLPAHDRSSMMMSTHNNNSQLSDMSHVLTKYRRNLAQVQKSSGTISGSHKNIFAPPASRKEKLLQ